MAKNKRVKKTKTSGFLSVGLLPLFIMTVCIVFSFMFTVMIASLGPITSDIKFIFIMLLVVSTTVASMVSLIYYIFFLKK